MGLFGSLFGNSWGSGNPRFSWSNIRYKIRTIYIKKPRIKRGFFLVEPLIVQNIFKIIF